MPINSVLAVVTVADFEAGLAWYERFFGRSSDRRSMDGLAEWQVTETASVQLVLDPDRAGSAMLTLGVDDLDSLSVDLAGRGLAVGRSSKG